MEQATFLGTPLTKYEIDDIDVEDKHHKVRSFFEVKGITHKQSRERIRKNQHHNLYTVDTEEGWTPSQFKSSRTHRATYNSQKIDNFTDVEDTDIISREVLKSLNLEAKHEELLRIAKSILQKNGMLRKKAFGPQLPTSEVAEPKFRSPLDVRGIGFYSNLYAEKAKCEEAEEDEKYKETDGLGHVPLKWVRGVGNYGQNEDEPLVLGDDIKTSHAFDRDLDLQHIRDFYRNLYQHIVKPLEITREQQDQELVSKYARKIEFTQDVSVEQPRAKIRLGRTIIPFEFSPDLLAKFKIKSGKPTPRKQEKAVECKSEEEEAPVQLPIELFKRIFSTQP